MSWHGLQPDDNAQPATKQTEGLRVHGLSRKGAARDEIDREAIYELARIVAG